MIDLNEVYYSVGGLAQYMQDLTDLLKYRITEKIKKIKINTSSQPKWFNICNHFLHHCNSYI